MRVKIVVVVLLLLLLTACSFLTDEQGHPLKVVKVGESTFALEVPVQQSKTFKALVKGSIYESGEMVSVFGTCLDGDDQPVNNSYALFSAWYPNGSILFHNVTMLEIQPGYYLYSGPMNVVQGTYLTQMECHINGSNVTAKAFGEWQNPFWVRRINMTYQQTLNNSQQLQNITVQIGNLSTQVGEGFNITWDKLDSINATINESYTNLSQQIYVVGQIANNSVDRNDSYIVQLLNQVINLTTPPSSGTPVNWTEEASIPVYMRMWHIKVCPFDPDTGRSLSYPQVWCTIHTDLPSPEEDMTPSGSCFKYHTFIWRTGDFNWFVNCTWI